MLPHAADFDLNFVPMGFVPSHPCLYSVDTSRFSRYRQSTTNGVAYGYLYFFNCPTVGTLFADNLGTLPHQSYSRSTSPPMASPRTTAPRMDMVLKHVTPLSTYQTRVLPHFPRQIGRYLHIAHLGRTWPGTKGQWTRKNTIMPLTVSNRSARRHTAYYKTTPGEKLCI